MTPPLKRTDSTTAVIDHKQPTLKDKLAAAWNAVKEPIRRKRTHHLLKQFAKAQQSREIFGTIFEITSRYGRRLREIDARFNSISNIDVLSQLPKLEALMLGHNSASGLSKLTISKNHFAWLSNHFGSLVAESIPFKSSKTGWWVESTYGSGSTFFFTCIACSESE
ncbi:hypothetical protein AC578_6488 [Pseudocercospora eumusae]|uniref:Uncharacterized protein n=1 Tax=Pseudocercospora eumusae TaxID=321146 RepID=A0A139HCY2_9PEZI|nr:hypothetical protein AC578_6488 [Pseudocercospora eumusae]